MEDREEIKVKCRGGGSIINHAPLFSPDGQSIFILWKNVIRSYSIGTGERITDYEGCDDTIIGAAIHPLDSKLLVACSRTGEIAVWKWQIELHMSVNRIERDIDEVISFHLIQDSYEATNCDILLTWMHHKKFHAAVFSLKDLKLKTEYSIILQHKPLSVDVGGSPGSQFLAVIDKHSLFYALLNGRNKVHKLKSGNKKTFTCLACHPEYHCLATGDNTGHVYVWGGLFEGGLTSKAEYHWHTLPVNTLAFSQSGTVLYSGGSECVLVKWQLDNTHKDFLPRLPASIVHLSTSPGNVYMAISTQNNGIHIIDSHFKIKRVIQELTWAVTTSAGINVEPRTKSLVLNGHVGNVQFYSPHTTSLLYNLDVVGQNKLTQERQLNIPNTNVSKIAVNKFGDWLACVEDRIDDDLYKEIRLKFFHFDDHSQTYILNTSIEFPHENGVNGLEFQSTSRSNELMCATSGNDNQFKIWSLVDTTDIYRKSRSWRCSSSGYYKNHPANAVSFSTDGSLLAVAFGPCVTAWSPDTCDLKCSLVHPSFRAPLRAVHFGNVDKSHLVVAASAERLCVWNLLTLALVWTVPVRVAQLCVDPISTYMAVFTADSSLYVFTPDSSSPEFFRRNLTADKSKVTAAAFVPHVSERRGGLLWQKMSNLYFMNSNQELLCLETEEEFTGDATLQYSSRPQRSAFDALLAETRSSLLQKQSSKASLMDKGLTAATEIKQLIEPPAHTMAPMRLLCNSVLRSLIMRESLPKSDDPTAEESESLDDFEPSSDTEVEDLPSKRRTMKIPTQTTPQEPSKTRKENLKAVITDALSWTSVLVD